MLFQILAKFHVVSDSKINIVSLKNIFFINYFNRTYYIKNTTTIPIQQQESTTDKNKQSTSTQLELNTSVDGEEEKKLKQNELNETYEKIIDTSFEDQAESDLSQNNSTFYNLEDEDLKEINKSMEEMTQQVEKNLTTNFDSSSSSS